MSPSKKKTQSKKSTGARKANGKKQNKSLPTLQAPPSAYGKPMRLDGPKIHANEKFVRIVHREPLGLIPYDTGTFTVAQFLSINPGLAASFKWLSTQAVAWEKYQFEKLEYEFVSRVPTSSSGSIMLAIDHDAADAVPINEDIMLNYGGAIEDSVWCKSMKVIAKCDNTWRFVRTQGLQPNLDVKTYDLGNFISATAGVSVDSTPAVIGKCYVSYIVKMKIPQLPSNYGPIVGGTVQGGGTLSAGNPLGSIPIPQAGFTGATVNAISRLTFPTAGQFLSALTVGGTGLTALSNPTIISGGASITDSGAVIGAGSTLGLLKSIINVTNPPAVIDYNFAGGATTVTSSHLDLATGPGSII